MSLLSHEITIANELSISEKQVRTTIQLLEEGATVPFISRYRKEMTGSLDEVQITNIRDRSQQLKDLDKRKEAVLKSIVDQGKLTPELEQQVMTAETMANLEDIYLPYKPKRKTRASVAREKDFSHWQIFFSAGKNRLSGTCKFVNRCRKRSKQ
nr:Tex-like N-terminal domain-containing protein [Sphingobacterium sp. E70]